MIEQPVRPGGVLQVVGIVWIHIDRGREVVPRLLTNVVSAATFRGCSRRMLGPPEQGDAVVVVRVLDDKPNGGRGRIDLSATRLQERLDVVQDQVEMVD